MADFPGRLRCTVPPGRLGLPGLFIAAVLAAGCAAPRPSPAATRLNEHPAAAAASAPAPALPVATTFAPVEPSATGFSAEPWSFDGIDGHLITTPHFLVYTTIHSEFMVERLPAFYEGCLLHYTTALAPLPEPEQPLRSYIFRDERQWRSMTREVLTDQADEYMNLGRGGFTTQGISVLFDIGQRDTFAIAAHEGWHQYTQQTFKHPLPIWLEEGIATYMEAITSTEDGGTRFGPARNRERHLALREAFNRGELIPLEELLQKSPQAFLNTGKDRLLTYYAQVWALTRFLAEGEDGRYREALRTLLVDAADGHVIGRIIESRHVRADRRASLLSQTRSGPVVLLAYFNRDLAAFSAGFEQFVNGLVARRHARGVDSGDGWERDDDGDGYAADDE